MLHHSRNDTVISIGAGVRARQPIPSFVPCHPKSQSEFCPELLELGNRAVRDHRRALGEQQVHQRRLDVDLVADGVGEEICVEDDLVGGLEGFVVLEEHVRGFLRDVTGCFELVRLLLLLCFRFGTAWFGL